MIDKTDPCSIETVADWAARSMDPDFDDWVGLSAWLSGDHDRNRRYNEAMVAIEDGIAGLRASAATNAEPRPHGPVEPRRRMPRRWHRSDQDRRMPVRWIVATGGGMLVAAMAGVLILSPVWAPPVSDRIVVVETPPGAAQRVNLADGSRIELAGGSRVTLNGTRSRAAVVERGRALFSVQHDNSAPFSVIAGVHELLDVGTVFEVVREKGAVRVSVAEGAVVLDPNGRPLMLTAGSRVVVRDRLPERRVTRVAPAQIGRWRQARLSYHDAPLPQVTDDLAGALGVSIWSSPTLAGRRFTGTLVPATLRERPEALGDVFDAHVHVGEDGWELRPR